MATSKETVLAIFPQAYVGEFDDNFAVKIKGRSGHGSMVGCCGTEAEVWDFAAKWLETADADLTKRMYGVESEAHS